MKPAAFILSLIASSMLAHAAPDGLALATKNGCLACHSVDAKIVGPSYKEVAAKYRNDKGAAAKLLAKVKSGGAGNWGSVSMPPQPASAADIKIIVDWVLSQK